MKISLSDHFTYGRLLRFVVPSVGMMLFASLYSVVDGIFVSNFAGATPFAAINLIIPYMFIFSSLGFMVGTGGSALVAMIMGEGKGEKAKAIFSQLIYFLIAAGVLFTIVGIATTRKAAILLGSTEEMLPYCVVYGRIIMLGIVPFMLQNAFQSLMITAEKPQLGFDVTVAAGCTNMLLDALFVGFFKWGVVGAGCATVISQMVGGVIPLVYFLTPNSSRLRLVKPEKNLSYLGKACLNGASEFMTNISLSLVSMLYNFQLMRIAGENGVAAYGVMMYVCFIFLAAFLGYAVGCAPIISYHYGAGNADELKNMFKKSLVITGAASIIITSLGYILARPFSLIYVSYNEELLEMTVRGFFIYSASYLVVGFNIFGSAFFTALNNGIVSAAISFLRTLVFQAICVIVLPMLFGLDGVWGAMAVAEVLAVIVTVTCMVKYRGRYHYA